MIVLAGDDPKHPHAGLQSVIAGLFAIANINYAMTRVNY